jgi:rhodanese-related sulfurtransferase
VDRKGKAAMAPARIKAEYLKKIISDGQEVAILDPREEGAFGENHLLLAVNVPLSKLELRIEDLVPRKSTRIVLTDGGDGLAERTAARLNELGYHAVAILDGGLPAWSAAGYQVFIGLNVPTKAFGEWVEHHYGTPSISPEELHAKLGAGEDIVVLDARPREEYQRMSIPGAINVPGAELVYRFHQLPIRPSTIVVVNCAGRTRSILGAQSLISAGVKKRVAALAGGTMAWETAGFACEHGANRRAPEPSEKALKLAQAAAAKVAERCGVETIDAKKLAEFETQRRSRTLYVVDVRTEEEYLSGHRPGSIHAPGGQLVQAIDKYVATRHARLVLIDDKKVRAQMTGSWLVQAGWSNVSVLAEPFAGLKLETGERPVSIPGLDRVKMPLVQPADLNKSLQEGAVTVIDFATSFNYRKGHIPGAWFAVRSRLAECLKQIPNSHSFVATGDDPALTALAAADLSALSGKLVSVLAGGNKAWGKAGLPFKEGFEHLATKTDDVWLRPYDLEERVKALEAAVAYLRWEEGLLEQIERDGDLHFGLTRHI